MRETGIEKLVEWLGSDGAIAGLESSDVTVSELCEMAARRGLSLEKRARRGDIIVDLVHRIPVRIDRTTDELLKMSRDDLGSYFRSRKVSRTELVDLLSQFDIRSSPGDRVSLVDLAAREISDVGMYQRVAMGGQRKQAFGPVT